MDNKISFKANIVTNGIVSKNITKAFEKATEAFPNDTIVLTKGLASDGLAGHIIATMKSARNFDGETTPLIFKAFTPFDSESHQTNKLVTGFKMMIEEATMNQKKYWVEKEIERANVVVAEQVKKAKITGDKGLTKISDAYKALAERSARKIDELKGKIDIAREKGAKNLNELAEADEDLQRFATHILTP